MVNGVVIGVLTLIWVNSVYCDRVNLNNIHNLPEPSVILY